MTQENFDLLDSVPEAQTGFRQYGKLTISTKVYVWRVIGKDENGKDKRALEEASRADFLKASEGDRAMDWVFNVNISEFKPKLGFPYERKVRAKGADWKATLAPSIEAIMGTGSMSKECSIETLKSLDGRYVAVIDVPEQPRTAKKGVVADPNAKQYNTVKFLKVYATREECLHDASEGFAGTASANGSTAALDPLVPEGWGKSDWLSMKDDPTAGIVPVVAKAIAEAEAANKDKPKPVQVRAVAAAKQAAIEKFASDMTCTVEQATALLNS